VSRTAQKDHESDAGDRFMIFLRCAGHISHHTGQMLYLCKKIAIS